MDSSRPRPFRAKARLERIALVAVTLLQHVWCAPPYASGPTSGGLPVPTPSPGGGATCSLPALPDCGPSCCVSDATGLFDSEIASAQRDLAINRPDLVSPTGTLRVDAAAYVTALALRITSTAGVCARAGGTGSIASNEVAVKSQQLVSQRVSVVSSEGVAQIGQRFTCRPANF